MCICVCLSIAVSLICYIVLHQSCSDNTFGAGSFICGVRDSFILGVRDSFISGDISIQSVLGHLNGNDSHDV